MKVVNCANYNLNVLKLIFKNFCQCGALVETKNVQTGKLNYWDCFPRLFYQGENVGCSLSVTRETRKLKCLGAKSYTHWALYGHLVAVGFAVYVGIRSAVPTVCGHSVLMYWCFWTKK